MAQEILDLDKLIPKKRIIKLAGKEIDVSKIPSSVVIEMTSKAKIIQSEGDEAFNVMIDLVLKVCNATIPDEKITNEWLVSNTSFEQLEEFIKFVMKPLTDKLDQEVKNDKSPKK